jgi:hypothetical protein
VRSTRIRRTANGSRRAPKGLLAAARKHTTAPTTVAEVLVPDQTSTTKAAKRRYHCRLARLTRTSVATGCRATNAARTNLTHTFWTCPADARNTRRADNPTTETAATAITADEADSGPTDARPLRSLGRRCP